MVTLGIWVEIVSRALANFQIAWDAIDDLEQRAECGVL
jgi:hypothetical protein